MKEFILDERHMTSMENFYREVENVLSPSLRKMGRNLYAFRDVLRGGFGAFDEGEAIKIWIINKKPMKTQLPENFLNSIFRIIEESTNVLLQKESRLRIDEKLVASANKANGKGGSYEGMLQKTNALSAA